MAERIPTVSLGLMANDPETYIRRIIAQRINSDDLELLGKDSGWTVRYEVAKRASPALLQQMIDDVEEEVRLIARQRYEAFSLGNNVA